MEIALKLYGTMKSLDIKKGILFAKNFCDREEPFEIFENLFIIPKAVEDLNSPNCLINYLKP